MTRLTSTLIVLVLFAWVHRRTDGLALATRRQVLRPGLAYAYVLSSAVLWCILLTASLLEVRTRNPIAVIAGMSFLAGHLILSHRVGRQIEASLDARQSALQRLLRLVRVSWGVAIFIAMRSTGRSHAHPA